MIIHLSTQFFHNLIFLDRFHFTGFLRITPLLSVSNPCLSLLIIRFAFFDLILSPQGLLFSIEEYYTLAKSVRSSSTGVWVLVLLKKKLWHSGGAGGVCLMLRLR